MIAKAEVPELKKRQPAPDFVLYFILPMIKLQLLTLPKWD